MNIRGFGTAIASLLSTGLILLITSCGGSAPSSQNSANLVAAVGPIITVTVTPSTATVFTSLTAQFSATVAGTANTAVTWSVNGVAGGNKTFGTITDAGLYTAPTLVPAPASFAITANSVASPSVSATAQVSIVTPIGIVLSPEYLTLLPGQTQYFTATVTGPVDSGLTWSVNGIPGGDSTVGTLSTVRVDGSRAFTGQYTAPNAAPLSDPVIVLATSTVDPAARATAQVMIQRDNQLSQATPIKLGTSGGNASDLIISAGRGGCCSGTLGSLVSRGGNFYILSNNHVLDKTDQGSVGDPIIQPGLGDVNCQPQNTVTVAHMSQAPSLHSNASNVDAAIAAIVPGAVDTSGTILDLAAPNQPAAPSATLADVNAAFSSNERVAKVGRTSGLTCSTITSVGTDLTVNYETSCGSTTSFRVAYTNQIVIDGSSFGGPGDSGSLVVTADTARPLGLLFAGNGTSIAVNPIRDVLSALKDPSSGELPQIVGSADHAVACPNSGLSLLVEGAQTGFTAQLDAKAVQRAQQAMTQYQTQLLQTPAVSGVSIGSSDDDPLQPALVVRVKGALQLPLPHQVGGVRTKIVFEQSSLNSAVARPEIERATQVKTQHSAEFMADPNVFGVGVGSSKDSPGEAAIVVYIDRNSTAAVPAEIDGTRTQIVRTDPFRTSGWGKELPAACSTRGTPPPKL